MNFIKQFFDYTASYSRSRKQMKLREIKATNALGDAAKIMYDFGVSCDKLGNIREAERKILSQKGSESISVKTAEEIGEAAKKGLEEGLRTPKKSFMENVFNELPFQDIPKTENRKNSYEKVFIEHFKQLTYTRRASEVWTDFVTMFACAISNAVDKEDKIKVTKRENMYLKAINKYSKDEQQIFPKLCSDIVMALEENPEQDFLGQIYMELGIGNKNMQQFFTPYSICELMAKITMGNIVEDVKNKGYASINDPCCGAGATLIAAINMARKELEKENINFQERISFVAQDIDFTVAMMCYIQLSLLGIRGCVKVGNSLTEPIIENDDEHEYWFTPMYFSTNWIYKKGFDGE